MPIFHLTKHLNAEGLANSTKHDKEKDQYRTQTLECKLTTGSPSKVLIALYSMLAQPLILNLM